MGLLDELLKAQKPKRNLMGTQMVKGPDQPYLRQDYPGLYGALKGLLGTAPDVMEGSVLDPNTAAVRQGAEYGFPVGTALAMLPGVGPLLRATKGLPVGMGIKDVSKSAITREGNPIQGAVVLVGDKIFMGRTHGDALNRAVYDGVVRKEGGKYIFPKGAEVNSDLFMTKDGQIIDRFQASKMFDIGASETAIKEGLMQNNPPRSMTVDSYIEQAKALKKQREQSPYPQQAALDLAQQRAALPVEQGGLGLLESNTAEQRAAAMGFTDNVFHGSKTPENIKKLVPGGESGSIRTGDAYGTGVYTSTDAAGDASAYGRDGAVFPLKINRSGHLKVDAPNSDDLQKLSKFAGESMLPSDKARFTVGRERREFADVQDARDFFANQRENWNQFGGGYDRARPEALANPDGSFAVEFTNFDASVPITSGNDANTLLRATGWDNVPNLGYSGHTLDMGSNRFWDITTDTDQLRSRFAAFDPFRKSAAIAATMGVAAPDLLASPIDEEELRRLQSGLLYAP